MDSLRDSIARGLVAEIERQTEGAWPVRMEPSPEHTGLVDADLNFAEMADTVLALFSDELDKVVDLDDLNDLHGKIGDK